jgi:hypothetical protein
MLRPVAYAFAGLFLFAAALQYNDPDPLRWVAIYVAAAVSCAMTARGRTDWPISAVTAGIALGWALVLLPHAWRVPPFEMFNAWEMADERIEVAREMYGLLLVFGACAVFARHQWSARRARELAEADGAPPV